MINKYNEYLKRFKISNISSIWDAYDKPSEKKVDAYVNLLTRNDRLNINYNRKIIGCSCHFFTLATYIPAIDCIIIDSYANTYVYNKDYGQISWTMLLNMIDDYKVNRY